MVRSLNACVCVFQKLDPHLRTTRAFAISFAACLNVWLLWSLVLHATLFTRSSVTCVHVTLLAFCILFHLAIPLEADIREEDAFPTSALDVPRNSESESISRPPSTPPFPPDDHVETRPRHHSKVSGSCVCALWTFWKLICTKMFLKANVFSQLLLGNRVAYA